MLRRRSSPTAMRFLTGNISLMSELFLFFISELTFTVRLYKTAIKTAIKKGAIALNNSFSN